MLRHHGITGNNLAIEPKPEYIKVSNLGQKIGPLDLGGAGRALKSLQKSTKRVLAAHRRHGSTAQNDEKECP
jgi:hypothetical protein